MNLTDEEYDLDFGVFPPSQTFPAYEKHDVKDKDVLTLLDYWEDIRKKNSIFAYVSQISVMVVNHLQGIKT